MRAIRYSFMIICLLSAILIFAQSEEGIMIPADTTAMVDFRQDPPRTYRIRQYADQPTILTISGMDTTFTAEIFNAGGDSLAAFAEGVFVVMLDLGSGDAVFTVTIATVDQPGVVLLRVGTDFDAEPPTVDEAVILPPATATPTNTFTPSQTFTPTNTFTPTFTPSNTFTPTNTLTPTHTFTATFTATDTFTPTFTPSNTPTLTATESTTRQAATRTPVNTRVRATPTNTRVRATRIPATATPTRVPPTQRITVTVPVTALADANYQLNIPMDSQATISDAVSYPEGDREDRVFYDVMGINPDSGVPGGKATLIITATCEGEGVETVTFFTGGQTFGCGDTIITREVVFDSKSGSVLISATGGDRTFVTWTLTGTAARVNP